MKKKFEFALSIFTLIIVLFISYSLFSCGQANKEDLRTDQPKDLAEKHNKAKSIESKGAEFLVEAAEISLKEIELSKLAQKKSMSAETKKISRDVEKEHSRLLDELKKLADEKRITIPTEINGNAKEQLESPGRDFDKEYCNLLVENHKEAVKKFKSASEDVEDIDIKNWAGASLTVLRDHLDNAMTCYEFQKNNENAGSVSKNTKSAEVK